MTSFGQNLKAIQPVASRTPSSKLLCKQVPGREQSNITVIEKTHAWHYVDLKEAATWIPNGVQWFNILEQLMMIAIWTRDWQDAAKFQDLLQILQVNFQDYIRNIPKWQILLQHDDDMPKKPRTWQFPSTVWDGQPVIGFMAETTFEDAQGRPLPEVSFADFNPMWSFPNTSVKSNYENISFGHGSHRIFKRILHIQRML